MPVLPIYRHSRLINWAIALHSERLTQCKPSKDLLTDLRPLMFGAVNIVFDTQPAKVPCLFCIHCLVISSKQKIAYSIRPTLDRLYRMPCFGLKNNTVMMELELHCCRGSRRNSRQMSRQLSDAYGRGLNPQDSFSAQQPGHSRQASMDAGPRVSFSRQESMDVPTMSLPGKVAFGEAFLSFHYLPLLSMLPKESSLASTFLYSLAILPATYFPATKRVPQCEEALISSHGMSHQAILYLHLQAICEASHLARTEDSLSCKGLCIIR